VRTWWWLPENGDKWGDFTSFESCNELISSHQERRGREHCAHLRHHACIKNDVDVSTAHTCDTMLEMEATIAPGLDCNTMSCAVTVICHDDMWCAERCAHPDDKL
jgi:hypothetical protein